ncbi:MAG: virulence RhuM family protein [Mycolicibacterium sp.]|uniref:Uncharacterized protein n=1 Tax=Mycolicibacterium insubricum TaxID=444597 RepID=A0A1X0DFI7_9MYCO|nr:RhuM family protein [Mycolicibacterium insubricum]MCB9439899.1 virulence RhuM family protein [Mycolicibacterium sp.]MCV7082548.1 virulence RhuM family protein [Mycolicibacterium insubricum]ORA70590.1 hypothetical protein BST26_10480 [Mycolicibacterium insubricum]
MLTCCNLDLIISVGYRVNSKVATQFRIWATERLRDYPVRGYAINEQRRCSSFSGPQRCTHRRCG